MEGVRSLVIGAVAYSKIHYRPVGERRHHEKMNLKQLSYSHLYEQKIKLISSFKPRAVCRSTKKMNDGLLSKSTTRGNVYHCASRSILRYSAKTKGETIGGVGPGWVLRKMWLDGIVATKPPSAHASLFNLLLFNQI